MKKSVRKQRKSLRKKRRNTKKHNRKSVSGGADNCRIADLATRTKVGTYVLPGFWEKMNPYTQTEYTNARIACNEQRKKEKSEIRRREQEMDENAQSKLTAFTLDPIENPRT
jgi:hypothetical protein